MPKHAAPRTRSPFWTLTAGAVAAVCIALGTLGVTTTTQAQNEPAHTPQTGAVDAAGCWFDPTVPGWVTEQGDGVCRTGEHAVTDVPRSRG